MAGMTQLLTPRDVDRILIYPAGRARRLAREGRLPAVTLPDGQIRFRREDIERLIDPTPQQTQEARANG